MPGLASGETLASVILFTPCYVTQELGSCPQHKAFTVSAIVGISTEHLANFYPCHALHPASDRGSSLLLSAPKPLSSTPTITILHPAAFLAAAGSMSTFCSCCSVTLISQQHPRLLTRLPNPLDGFFSFPMSSPVLRTQMPNNALFGKKKKKDKCPTKLYLDKKTKKKGKRKRINIAHLYCSLACIMTKSHL